MIGVVLGVVAGFALGRNRTLVHPKQMHAIPFEIRSHHAFEQELGS